MSLGWRDTVEEALRRRWTTKISLSRGNASNQKSVFFFIFFIQAGMLDQDLCSRVKGLLLTLRLSGGWDGAEKAFQLIMRALR